MGVYLGSTSVDLFGGQPKGGGGIDGDNLAYGASLVGSATVGSSVIS